MTGALGTIDGSEIRQTNHRLDGAKKSVVNNSFSFFAGFLVAINSITLDLLVFFGVEPLILGSTSLVDLRWLEKVTNNILSNGG